MSAIGYVTRDGEGYKGQLRTLSIRAPIEIVPNRRKAGASAEDRSGGLIWSEAAARSPASPGGEISSPRWFRAAAAVPGLAPRSRYAVRPMLKTG